MQTVKIYCLLLAVFVANLLNAQEQNYVVRVLNIKSNTTIPFASVGFNGNVFLADAFGSLSIKLPVVTAVKLKVTCFGYVDTSFIITTSKNNLEIITLTLEEKYYQIKTLKLTKNTPHFARIKNGVVTTNGAILKNIPTVFSDPDPIKAMQFLPGINTVQENNTGIYIRGGNLDQTMTVLDDVPLYQTSHLSGYFSSFNADAISQLNIYKSGVPANFGGRGSSVLDVRSADGSMNEFKNSMNIGLMSIRTNNSGYLIKNKLSYISNLRLGYPEAIAQLLLVGNMSSYFADGLVKLKYQMQKNSFLTLTGFFSRDFYNTPNLLSSRNYIDISNRLISLKYYKPLSSRLFLNSTLGYSSWKNGDLDKFISPNYYSYGIANIINKQDFKFSINRNTFLNFGLNLTYYQNQKSIYFPSQDFANNPFINKALETALYSELGFKLSEKLNATVGVRPTLYLAQQPYSYKHYSLSPRLKLDYQKNEKNTFFFHAERMLQMQHVLSKNITSDLEDFWTSSNDLLPPQISNSISLGLNNNQTRFNYNIEGYFRVFENTFDYKEGADLSRSDFYDQLAALEQAYAYGLEQSISFNFKGWSAMANYVYSRSLRKAPLINDGNLFPALMDRPHFASILIYYQINPKWKLNAAWKMQSGRPTTVFFDNYFASKRNEIRFPLYHRMDVGLEYTKRPKKVKNQSSWLFSVYNLYNRQNVYALVFSNLRNQLEAVTLFPILPTFSYHLKIN